MTVEIGHDLITRFDWNGSITPGIKVPASYVSSGKSSLLSRIRYAFCFVAAVDGSTLRCSWHAGRVVSPFDTVQIPATLTAAITPIAGSIYMSRINMDALGHELSYPAPAGEFGSNPNDNPNLQVEWLVVGGTSLTCAFMEWDVPANQKTPSFSQSNGLGSGLVEKDSNGNDKIVSDFAIFPANSVYKPAGNGTLT